MFEQAEQQILGLSSSEGPEGCDTIRASPCLLAHPLPGLGESVTPRSHKAKSTYGLPTAPRSVTSVTSSPERSMKQRRNTQSSLSSSYARASTAAALRVLTA